MLVLGRNKGEWITVGDDLFIQVDEVQKNNKREGMLKLKVMEETLGGLKEYIKYISKDSSEVVEGVDMAYVGKRGSEQYKVAIRANDDLYIGRLDKLGGLEEDEEEVDELLEMYREELGWFFD